MSSPVREELVDSVLVVTLDRPPVNAVDVATSHALYAAFARGEADERVRVTLLTASGSTFFSAGWDLKAAVAHEAIDADHGPGGFGGLTELWGRRTPVVAAVNGLALGGGFELALAADLVVAADHVELGLPEVRLGLVADSGGLLRLPRRLPGAVAREMLLTGRRMGAPEAARWGLVNRVVPAAELLDAALELCRSVIDAAPLAVAAVLEVEQATEGLDLAAGVERVRQGDLPAYRRLLGSEDAAEGPRAFTEKRRPVWRGR